MITNFEQITKEISGFETRVVMPLVVEMLKTKIGKGKATPNHQILQTVNFLLHPGIGAGCKNIISAARLRKVIGAIRVIGSIKGLCANSQGYFVAETHEEFLRCIVSLNERIKSQSIVMEAMKEQLLELY